jgi:threonine/homoserine/homoserine lactone efflux protein
MREELLFAATVLPLVCTPGPDILFVAAQSCAGGAKAGLKATAGICLGYTCHGVLASLGVAAAIAASPVLFDIIRWIGIAYLAWIAVQFLRSALKRGACDMQKQPTSNLFGRGFLTSALNPKGLMIFLALIPQFVDHGQPVASQAALLSAVFMGLCGIVYGGLSLAIGATAGGGGFTDRKRRIVEAVAGGLMALAACKLV